MEGGGGGGGGRKEGSRKVGENVEGISVQRQKSDGYYGYGILLYPRKYEWTKKKKKKKKGRGDKVEVFGEKKSKSCS